MIELDLNPPTKTLRQFAAAWLVFFLAWGTHQWLVRDHHSIALFIGLLGVVVGGAGLIMPRFVRWIYAGCMLLAFPIGWMVSQIALMVLFYCILTPIALFFRVRSRDALGRKPDPGKTTFWTPKVTPRDIRNYLRQY
ncbi:MAG: SxtJ family membrane protein [Syntrophobacteraceae bacterium]|jgi:hypothetical protein